MENDDLPEKNKWLRIETYLNNQKREVSGYEAGTGTTGKPSRFNIVIAKTYTKTYANHEPTEVTFKYIMDFAKSTFGKIIWNYDVWNFVEPFKENRAIVFGPFTYEIAESYVMRLSTTKATNIGIIIKKDAKKK